MQPVCDHPKLARPCFHAGRDVKHSVSRHGFGLNSSGAVVVSFGVEDVAGGVVLDAHQWIVGCGFKFVTEAGRLGHTTELPSDDAIRHPALHGGRADGHEGCPNLQAASYGPINSLATNQHLSGWKDDEGTGSSSGPGEVRAIKFVHSSPGAFDQ